MFVPVAATGAGEISSDGAAEGVCEALYQSLENLAFRLYAGESVGWVEAFVDGPVGEMVFPNPVHVSLSFHDNWA